MKPCAAVLVAMLACARTASAPAAPSPVGTNLAAVRDWSTELPFADLMKQSRVWISNTEATWDDGRPLDLDAHGWPKRLLAGQRARTLLMWGDDVKPAGDFVVTWQGHGQLDFWPQEATVDKAGSRAVIHADPKKGGLGLTITETDPANPVKDVHAWPVGMEGKLFQPAFLESLKGFSTLRFMDWVETNEARLVRFGERPVVEDARWAERGVPLEVMIDLCNATHTDMWLTIPDTWDDDAVAKAAALVHARLAPALALYVESSNEVWNGIFPQAVRARERGLKDKLAGDPFEAQLKRHAARSVEIFRAFEAAFERPRLVRVLASMAATPNASAVLLDAAGAHVDALAIAPYVGGSIADPGTATSVDAIFRALGADVAALPDLVRAHKVLADAHRVRLIAYEGGQHLVGDFDAMTAANRDPRMKSLYARMLQVWRDNGGGLFVHYLDVAAPSKFGRWGARESVDQPRARAPKLDALLTFAEGK